MIFFSKSYSFEWDENKNIENQIKHGVSFEQAQEAFLDASLLVFEDGEHSTCEKRWFCIGKVGPGILTVRFTLRNNKIRIIGAGFWRKGKKKYEKTNTD